MTPIKSLHQSRSWSFHPVVGVFAAAAAAATMTSSFELSALCCFVPSRVSSLIGGVSTLVAGDWRERYVPDLSSSPLDDAPSSFKKKRKIA